MKKTLVAVLALVLALTVCCGAALAAGGDLTIRDAKAYSDAEMTKYAGTIPAGTALVVRSYDSYADVYLNGKVYYISNADLLDKDISGKYEATLLKGTRVYQRPSVEANTCKLKNSYSVNVCAVKDDWALVHSNNQFGAYAYVPVSYLVGIRVE